MATFLEALTSGRVLLMDGAMGTELQRAGLASGECSEAWNLTQPDKVRRIHQAYVDAGAEVLLTNTFQANPLALARHQLADRVKEINEEGIAIARSVTGNRPFVVGDIGPFELDATNDLRDVACSFLRADAVLLETWSDPVALLAVRNVAEPLADLSGVPTLLSLTYHRRSGPNPGIWSHGGQPPEWFAMQARLYGVAALGVNCGRDIGLDEVIEIIRRYRKVTDLPLFARPNAGTPTRDGDKWVYAVTPEMMAKRLPELLEAGATMVGGCCGTTPAHLAALAKALRR
jgi:5-methyltetrahydrofolate--homocysteine methyltransferase